MKKIISIFLLLVIFVQSVECLVIFKLQQLQIKYEVKHQILSNLPDDELVLIKLDNEAAAGYHFWGSDEFSHAGHMYDVVRKERHGEKTWYYCYSDNKETELLANLNEYVKRRMRHDPEKRKERIGFQRLLHSMYPGMMQNYKPLSKQVASIVSNYSFHIKTWTHPPLTHPPQRV